MQARNSLISTLNTQDLSVPSKGVIWVMQQIPAGSCNSKGQHFDLYNQSYEASRGVFVLCLPSAKVLQWIHFSPSLSSALSFSFFSFVCFF